MREVIFKNITINNFCNIRSFSTPLSKKTVIKGFNRQGKTTVKNAILFVTTGKLSDGSAAEDNVRRHDENGQREDGTDIRVDLTISVDGAEYILTKIQRQKWVKKRGQEEQEFSGNENLYEINGIPKRKADYESWISENICDINELPFCINAMIFLGMDMKKKRAKLMLLAREITNAEIIEKYPEFKPLENDLKVGTPDELVTRAKKAIKELKNEQTAIPVRVDEITKTIVQMDFAELEIQRNDINERLAQIDAANGEATAIRKQITQAQIELQTVKEKLLGGAKDEKHNLELKISELNLNNKTLEGAISEYRYKMENVRQQIATTKAEIMEKQVELDKAVNSEFEANSFVCPVCGQLFPLDKQEAKRKEFEGNKAAKIARLTEYIEVLKTTVHKHEKTLEAAKAKAAEVEAKTQEIRSKITALDLQLANTPTAAQIDYESDNEYMAVKAKITDLETQLAACAPKENKVDLMAQLDEVNRKLNQKEVNIKAEERVAELRDELKAVAEKILNQEHILHLLEQFNIKRIEMVETSVNQYFDRVKWAFFSPLINGSFSEICRATIDGTEYDTLLNKSDRLLCQADICRGFMKANNIQLPVLLDDSESIDANRIPDFENQMLIFRREDCELTADTL